jgi:hypothetical protein
MAGPRHFQFFSKDQRNPYIIRLIDYLILDTEGSITFDGYYYVSDEEFPIRTFYNTTLREEKPYEEKMTDEGYVAKYSNIEDIYYEIEIYERQKTTDTSKISEINDEDGKPMRVCFFPTCEQKIKFRVIRRFESFDEFLGRATEHFNEGKDAAPTTIVYESSNEVLANEVPGSE